MTLTSKIFSIDSSERINIHNRSNPMIVRLDNWPLNNNFKKVCCLKLEFPKSWYLIDVTNNTFLLEGNAPGFYSEIITLTPNRNYNVIQLRDEIEFQIISVAPVGTDWDVVFDNDTGKFSITEFGLGSNFSLDFTNSGSLAKYMGFLNKDYDTNTVQISPNVVDLTRYNQIRVRSNISNRL